jgi:hypothetical protein
LLFFPFPSVSAPPRLSGENSLQPNRHLYVDHQASRSLAVNGVGQDRPHELSDSPLDGPKASQTRAGPGEEFATLLRPPPLGVRLLGMAMADGFALHRRRFALLAITPKLLASPVIGVSCFRHPVGHGHAGFSDHPITR